MREATEKYRNDESNEDDEHLSNVCHRVNPYLVEQSVASHHFYESPEDNDSGEGVADAPTPRLDAHLTAQHEERGNECQYADGEGKGMT